MAPFCSVVMYMCIQEEIKTKNVEQTTISQLEKLVMERQQSLDALEELKLVIHSTCSVQISCKLCYLIHCIVSADDRFFWFVRF